MTRSVELQPGTKVRHIPSGDTLTLVRRKDPTEHGSRSLPFHPGWWIEWENGRGRGSGLADFVLDNPESDYEVTAGDEVARSASHRIEPNNGGDPQ